MPEQSTHAAGIFTLYVLAAFGTLHPWAATGAIFGCFLFIAMPGKITKLQKLFLSLFSWGCGYALGVMLYGEGPPWEQKAMFVSVASAALAAVIFTSLYRVVESGGELPPWLTSVLERVPFLKRKE